jgi:hypothetical protein
MELNKYIDYRTRHAVNVFTVNSIAPAHVRIAVLKTFA